MADQLSKMAATIIGSNLQTEKVKDSKNQLRLDIVLPDRHANLEDRYSCDMLAQSIIFSTS